VKFQVIKLHDQKDKNKNNNNNNNIKGTLIQNIIEDEWNMDDDC
jgi:hypothetical protein